MQLKISLEGKEQFAAVLKDIENRGSDLQKTFKAAGLVIIESVNRNFIEGGRPTPWAPLKPATIRRRRGWGNPQILRDSGLMMASIGDENDWHGIYRLTPLSLEIGTNAPQAAPHQFGATSGSSHTVVVPARPFMMLQPADADMIARIAADDLVKGEA
jgi:phage virion morphogenesis protein